MAEFTVEEALEKLAVAKKAVKEAIDKYGKGAITSLLENAIENHKDNIDGFTWTQYTPYFNDGDPCVFSVGDVNVIPKGKDPEECQYDEYSSWSLNRMLKEDGNDWVTGGLASDLEKINQVFAANEDVLLAVFDDHVSVTATSEGIEVEQYDHD